MPYTPMSDLGQQGLFDITRTLLQQPDLGALSDALTRLVRQSALADSAAIVLWHSATHRASYFSTRDNGKIFEYEDETFLAHGPVRRSSPRKRCTAILTSFARPGRSWQRAIFTTHSATTACCRWRWKGKFLAAASLSAIPTSPSLARRSTNACTPLPRLWPLSRSNIESRVTNNVDYDLLSRERDNFPAFWLPSPTPCSPAWTWMSWSAKCQKRSITILKSMPSALRYAATGKATNILLHPLP